MNTHTRTLFRIISRSQLCIAFVKQFGAGTFFQAKCLQRPRAVINFGAASGWPSVRIQKCMESLVLDSGGIAVTLLWIIELRTSLVFVFDIQSLSTPSWAPFAVSIWEHCGSEGFLWHFGSNLVEIIWHTRFRLRIRLQGTTWGVPRPVGSLRRAWFGVLIVQDAKNGRTEGWSQRKQNGRDPRNGLTQGLHIRNRMHLFLMFPYTVNWRWWIRDTWIMGSRSWHVGNHRTSTWHPLILFYWNWLPFVPRHVSFSDAHDKKAHIIPDIPRFFVAFVATLTKLWMNRCEEYLLWMLWSRPRISLGLGPAQCQMVPDGIQGAIGSHREP